jgi:hypothetical protein
MPTLLSTFAALFIASGAAAQTTATISERPGCKACVASIKPVILLGSDSDPAGFSPLVQMAVGRGAYFVSAQTFPGEIYMYDAAGKFVKSIGRKGSGPGEMERPVFLSVGAGDSIHAVEMGSNRHHVLSPKGELVRTTSLRDPVNALAASRDGSLFTSSKHAEGKNFTLLDHIAANGDVISSLERADLSVPTTGRSYVAVDPVTGDRWSISVEHLRVTHWGKNDTPAAVFTGTRPWFTEGMPPQGKDPRKIKPIAWIGGLGFASGSLLIYYLVPDAKWAPMDGPLEINRIYDTRIEVVNPRTGQLMAVKQIDAVYLPIEGDKAYTMVEGKDGNLQIQVAAVSVTH